MINSQGQGQSGLPVGGTWTQCRVRGHSVSDGKQWGIQILNGHQTLPGWRGCQNPRKRACTPSGPEEAKVRQRQDPLVYQYSWKLWVNIHGCFLERSYLFPQAPEGSNPYSYQHVLFLYFLVFCQTERRKRCFLIIVTICVSYYLERGRASHTSAFKHPVPPRPSGSEQRTEGNNNSETKVSISPERSPE